MVLLVIVGVLVWGLGREGNRYFNIKLQVAGYFQLFGALLLATGLSLSFSSFMFPWASIVVFLAFGFRIGLPAIKKIRAKH